MNKTLIWILVALGALLIIGNGLAWYFLVYKVQKTEPVTTSNENANSAANQNANANANKNKNTNTSTGDVSTVKSVHCLQNPTKGEMIKISNLTDYSTTKSPLTFSGTANVFENTFSYRLKDCRGPIIKEGTITATGEAGTNATFSQTISFTPSRSPLDAILEVYELSVVDGSETNLFQVPLRLTN